MSNYVEPASVPDHIKQAMVAQTKRYGLDFNAVVAICRTWESLRPEAMGNRENWYSAVDLEESSRILLRERLDSITENAIEYLRNYSEAPDGAEDELKAFEVAFKIFLASEVGFRAQIAILRALEISENGAARLHPTRFKAVLSDERGAQGESALSEQQHLAERAGWVIDAIELVQYRGLAPEEVEVINDIKEIDTDDIAQENVTTLEYLLVKAVPNHDLWSSAEGRRGLYAAQLVEMRKDLAELEKNGFPGIEKDQAEFLREAMARSNEDLDHSVISRIFKVIAESRK